MEKKNEWMETFIQEHANKGKKQNWLSVHFDWTFLAKLTISSSNCSKNAVFRIFCELCTECLEKRD